MYEQASRAAGTPKRAIEEVIRKSAYATSKNLKKFGVVLSISKKYKVCAFANMYNGRPINRQIIQLSFSAELPYVHTDTMVSYLDELYSGRNNIDPPMSNT
jgi:hypothetical protein